MVSEFDVIGVALPVTTATPVLEAYATLVAVRETPSLTANWAKPGGQSL
jgi:hypothetical protein